MKKFIFNGDWCFDINLPEFSKLHSINWFTQERDTEHKTKLINGFLPFIIHDDRTYEPDPTSQQIIAIEYLLNNEKQIIASLFQSFKHDINEFYADLCGEYGWIPELNTVEDLGKLIGIHSIMILKNQKDGISYFQIECEYLGDEEHGLIIIMHKDRLIGYSEIGAMAYECIYKDLGLEGDIFSDPLEWNRGFVVNIVHKPIEKYGKFKPWQLNATEDYFRSLINKNENEIFIKELESSNWNINYRFPILEKNLIDMAIDANNIEAAEYLVKKGADFSKSISQISDYYNKKEAVMFLVKYGVSIDIFDYHGFTPLYIEIRNYFYALQNKKNYQEKDSEKYEKATKKMKESEERIKFYLSMGANPRHCNQNGNTYKEILSMSWNSNYINETEAIKETEALIESLI